MSQSQEDSDSSKLQTLQKIANEIKESWYKDKDKTEYMKELTDILKEILEKDTIEEYFSNNEETLNYFMDSFFSDVIGNILTQSKVLGEDGDEIALDLLFHIYKLFLKFHKNVKYSPLFKKIRDIFHRDSGSTSYFSEHKFEDDSNNYGPQSFNLKFCSSFEKQRTKFNVGDEIDFIIDYNNSRNLIDKKAWIRGKIKEIEDDQYVVQCCEDDELKISTDDYNNVQKVQKLKIGIGEET